MFSGVCLQHVLFHKLLPVTFTINLNVLAGGWPQHLYPYYSVIWIVLTCPCGALSASRGFARGFIFFVGHFPCLENRKL